jgi:LAS seventeen-binding protein 5
MSNPNPPSAEDVTAGLAAANISLPESEVSKLQERQRIAVERVKVRQGSISNEHREESKYVHPDLQDLNFGSLGDEKRFVAFRCNIPFRFPTD